MHTGGGGVWQHNPNQPTCARLWARTSGSTTNGDEEGRISFGRNYHANKRKKTTEAKTMANGTVQSPSRADARALPVEYIHGAVVGL